MSRAGDIGQALLSPSPLGLVIAVVLILTIPLFLHFYVYQKSGLTTLPSILLIGPSGAGKTSLLTLLERGTAAATHTSQTPAIVECSLPVEATAASNRYRSVNDPSNQIPKKFLLIDTPGHGKLRHHASDSITNPQNLQGLIFVVDAASLSAGDEGLRQTSEYLHDTLLLLQQRTTLAKSSNTPKEIPVLIAANKMDLFTALPAALIKNTLEIEINKIRNFKSKGFLDSGIGMDDAIDNEDKDDWLGEMGSKEFKFVQLEEFNVSVEVAGGNVLGGDGPNVSKWWMWIGERL